MGHALFFMVAVLAGLLWTAACTAAAARVERGWLKALLAAVGAGLPVIAVLPVVAATWWFAFGMRIQSTWFPHAITVLLSLLIGGAWIVRAGLTSQAGGEPPAARWPLIGLAALCMIAKAVTVGVLLILDNAVAAQAPYLRLEAANLIQSNLPPVVADADNAAALHVQAGAAIDADKGLGGEDSPLDAEGDVMREAVTACLARHSDTLDMIRRAADRDVCRFTRDWTRPWIDMILSEVSTMRGEGRLLALAARRASAEGRPADALADVVRMQRLAHQVASEPILVSYLVGVALDQEALATLADVLPRLGSDDAPLLDLPAVRDLVARRMELLPALYGEEAFGLTMFAGFADGRIASADVFDRESASARISDVGPIFRVFFLEGDIAGYRKLMHRFQQLAASRDVLDDVAFTKKQTDAIEREFADHPPGVLSSLVVPAVGGMFRARIRNEAKHRAATVLLGATKQRLAMGVLPLEPKAFVEQPSFVMPADPFAGAGKPLKLKRSEAGLAVYSVGPDGEDDGGPPPADCETAEGNDDVGLVMAIQ
jgi:hypothetical protein